MGEERHPRLWIGTSGWVYPHWREVFYPAGLPTTRWLSHYTQHFPTVELNNSFYRLPSERAFQGWRYQLPPNWNCNLERLREFLALLPGGLDHVLEFRNRTWLRDEVFALLVEHGVAFCIISLPGFDCPLRITAPLVYIRMHGSSLVYGGCYNEGELRQWAERIRGFLGEGHDVYIYFNNDAFGYAVQNAQQLRAMLGE